MKDHDDFSQRSLGLSAREGLSYRGDHSGRSLSNQKIAFGDLDVDDEVTIREVPMIKEQQYLASKNASKKISVAVSLVMAMAGVLAVVWNGQHETTKTSQSEPLSLVPNTSHLPRVLELDDPDIEAEVLEYDLRQLKEMKETEAGPVEANYGYDEDDSANDDDIQEDEEDAKMNLGNAPPRDLMTDHSSSMHPPLAGNENLDLATCTPLSQLQGNAIPVGECYEVDTQDGSVLEYADGLAINGKLFFPSTANVVIRAKYVFVLGLLKIDPPAPGNQVKFSLYQEDLVYYRSNAADAPCGTGDGCNMGSKVIAVLGGKLDIQGYDTSCPTWEKLQAVGPETQSLKLYKMPEGLHYKILGGCVESAGHTSAWGKYSVRCRLDRTANVRHGDHRTTFVMKTSVGEITSNGIMHFAWNGNWLFFWPTVDATEVQRVLGGHEMMLYEVSTPALQHVTVSSQAASCWGAGTEIVLSSHTKHSQHRQVATVVDADTSSGVLTLDRGIQKPITVEDHPDFAVEVASLNRPVVFEAESDSGDILIGGHLIIHHTDVVQHIEGVEIKNFGQQGRLGRYPLHFHMSGDSLSSVRRNVVRDSNQRCYVIHGTNDVTLEENLAFNTVGHCYFLEAGTEVRNTFERNLGIETYKMPGKASDPNTPLGKLSSASGRSETDDLASTFWISNPDNSFKNNVVGGSHSQAYWFETRAAGTVDAPVTLFEGNEAHSTNFRVFTTYKPGWQPGQPTTIKNLKLYRNWGLGAFLHNTKNLVFDGGLFADNGLGSISVVRGDDITFKNANFYGHTGLNDAVRCHQTSNAGLSLHGFKKWHGAASTAKGSTLIDTNFYNYNPSDTGCAHIQAISFTTFQQFVHDFLAAHVLENVKFDDPSIGIDSSRIASIGVNDVNVEVKKDSTKTFSSAGVPGFVVSEDVTSIFPDNSCSDYRGSLKFCPGACLRTVQYRLDYDSDPKVVMIVKDSSGKSQTIARASHDNHHAGKAYASYTAVLPKDDFEISFELSGTKVDPIFNHEGPVMEAEPVSCTDFVTSGDLSVYDPNKAACDAYFDNLIANGEIEYTGQNCNESGECADYMIVGPCTESIGHTSAWGKYSVRCPLAQTLNLGNKGDHHTDFKMVPCYGASGTNPQNDAIFSDGIMHFAHNGKTLFFWPTVSAADVSSVFPVGTRMKLFTTAQGSLSPYDPTP